MKNVACALTLYLFLSAITPLLFAQKLNADERRIVDHIDANAAGAVSLLERIVNTESPTEDIAGVKASGAVLMTELERIGMSTRWIEMPLETKRAGHLVAETKGSRGKRILILGHLDTVLRGEKFRRDGDKAYGTGISDMHGGN